MKKRIISFVLSLLMILTLTLPDTLVYAGGEPNIEAQETTVQEEEKQGDNVSNAGQMLSQTEPAPELTPQPIPEPSPEPAPKPIPESTPELELKPTPEPTAEPTPTSAPEPVKGPTNEPTQESTEESTQKLTQNEAPETTNTPETSTIQDADTKPEETPDDGQSDEDTEETEAFDENQPFTMAMLAEVGNYTMDMNGMVDFSNFELEAETDDGEDCTEDCELHFENTPENIHGGELEKNVPSMAYNNKNAQHVYTYAHVGETKVYYVGNLTIYHNDGTKTPYVFYTTDKHIDKKTVYAVLKENEKISLVYQHGTYHNIKYELENKNGEVSEKDKENGWTEDKVFGAGRVKTVAEGADFNGTVQIPRGYTAKVTVTDESGKKLYDGIDLGKMMKYTYKTENPNTIWVDAGNKDALIFTDSFAVKDVASEVTVTVTYKKIEQFTFNSYYWSQTAKAANRNKNNVLVNYRISIPTSLVDADPNTNNCQLEFNEANNNSVTWRFNGITSGENNNAIYTWEMNQLYINGEPINVPMVALANEGHTETKTTTLSTGTVITLSVTSRGGIEGKTGRREYTLTATNCYEDLTVSAGNMVGHIHREFATRALIGVEKPQYWHGTTGAGSSWWDLSEETLIDKRNTPYDITTPFRLKPALGYGKLNVSFTDKESKVLQTNGELNTEVTSQKFIEYLKRTDTENSNDVSSRGNYEVVSYAEWKPSADGYYYCRATKDLDTYMNKESRNGVVLLWFYADIQRYGIDYLDGARSEGTEEEQAKAPLSSDIDFMPGYQNGGDKGYNILNNTKALVSNTFPVDKTGKFVFDYWQILLVENGVVSDEAKEDITDADSHFKNELKAGATIPLTEKALVDLGDCLYYNQEQQRNTLTLRAVWKKRDSKDPITYTVNYYLTKVQDGKLVDPDLIEQHQHTVNEGAMLVSDLWQDANKTLSANIMEILQGNNDNLKDYTEEGSVKWVIYEPATTTKIESVDKNNNIANIYLVKQPNLSISKKVEGKSGDLTKAFTFTITASNADKPLNGTYSYTGSVLPGVNGVTKPEDGTLEFKTGSATISLSHGQQITFTDLPIGCSYTVTEAAEGYTAKYNGTEAESITGTLESDAIIEVVNTKEDIAPTGVRDDGNRFGGLVGVSAAALLAWMLAEVWRSRKKA